MGYSIKDIQMRYRTFALVFNKLMLSCVIKKKHINLLGILLLIISFSSCATIIGSSRYYANVQVPGHPDATIEYKGNPKGTGHAFFEHPRREANDFSVIIRKDGCEPEIKNFTQRSFRGWAFAGSFIILPLGVTIDAISGSWWNPDVEEEGVSKLIRNYYIYRTQYTGCDKNKTEPGMD